MFYRNDTVVDTQGNQKLRQIARFNIVSEELIHFKQNKIIKVKYKPNRTYFILNYNYVAYYEPTKAIILDPKPLNMTVVESDDSQ
jgi:hypothetical protein